jgi:hypothetical protein
MTDPVPNAVQVIPDFFPEEILRSLVMFLRESNVRKHEFALEASKSRTTVPESIRAAVKFAAPFVPFRINIAILKWYRTTDDYKSEAYEPHHDPPSQATVPLFLATLTGEAEFTYWSEAGDVQRIRCRPNQVILLHQPNLLHMISPPLGPDGERFFLFLGFDTEL